jgi:hypothetical protein
LGYPKTRKINLFENSYRLILMCAAEKWTRAKEDISRKTAAQIRFSRLQ